MSTATSAQVRIERLAMRAGIGDLARKVFARERQPIGAHALQRELLGRVPPRQQGGEPLLELGARAERADLRLPIPP